MHQTSRWTAVAILVLAVTAANATSSSKAPTPPPRLAPLGYSAKAPLAPSAADWYGFPGAHSDRVSFRRLTG
jgi:hypothetical protein